MKEIRDLAVYYAFSGYYDCYKGCRKSYDKVKKVDNQLNTAPASVRGHIFAFTNNGTFNYVSTRFHQFFFLLRLFCIILETTTFQIAVKKAPLLFCSDTPVSQSTQSTHLVVSLLEPVDLSSERSIKIILHSVFLLIPALLFPLASFPAFKSKF